MKTSLCMLLLCVACFPACGGGRTYNPETAASINVGDSKEEVVKKLGDPNTERKLDKKADNGCSQMLSYVYLGGPTGAGAVIVLLDDNDKVCVKPAASDGSKK